MFIKTPIKGMRDILPKEMEIREFLLEKLKATYTSFGYSLIDTPCMEHIENLTNKMGGENEKLIFKVLKRGEKLKKALDMSDWEKLSDAGMRYDLTVPLGRYYANNSQNLTAPFKALQIGWVWRADRPQLGRYRQFTQCDIDILGDATINAEIELIYVATQFLSQVGVKGCTVKLNDRRILWAMAKKSGFSPEEFSDVFILLDKFDKIGGEGVKNQLKEAGYSQEKIMAYLDIFQGFINANDPFDYCNQTLGDYISTDVSDNLREIIEAVTSMSQTGAESLPQGIKLEFDPALVRGMSYYTGVIFEIVSDDFKGSSIAGGGRYDQMIGKFTGQNTAACGFSIGFERMIAALMESMEKAGAKNAFGGRAKIALLYSKKLLPSHVAALQNKCHHLRAAGTVVLVQSMNKNVGFQEQRLRDEGYSEFHYIKTPDEAETFEFSRKS